MATEQQRPEQSQRVFERLCRELADLRPGVHMAEMAVTLLRPTHDGRALVGLVDEGAAAVYYHYASRTLSSVPFDEHGLDVGASTLLARDLDDPRDWVKSHGDRVAWVARRYRDTRR
ncbi:MAG: hypothetical protein ABEJ57_05710 [Halobacteriaceae archaeon]